MATVESRNAYYKGTLAARKGRALSERPDSYDAICLAMWIAGFNDEMFKIREQEAEIVMLASVL